MNYLVYCIFRDRESVPDELPPGVDGAKVSRVAADGLAASFSRVRPQDAVPSVPRLQAYARVIEALHERCTVLPMRFGCELSTRAQLVELLCARRAEFQASLDEVEGCVEFSIRILLKKTEAPAPTDVGPAPACGQTSPMCRRRAKATLATARQSHVGGGTPFGERRTGASPGQAYLAKRKAWYVDQDHQWNEAAAAARRMEKAFDGLFLRCVTEPPPLRSLGASQDTHRQGFPASEALAKEAPHPGREQLLTLHFLVQRKDQEPFRREFRRLEKGSSERLLLTGPWPPYNFTSSPQATLALDRTKSAFSLALPVRTSSAPPWSRQETP